MTVTTYPVSSSAQVSCDIEAKCECSPEEHQDNRLLRGILVAVPTSLALWVGVLKVVIVLFRH